MAWECADKFFPSGKVWLPDGRIITVEELKNSDIETVYRDMYDYTISSVKEKQRYVWGKDGQFAIIDLFNAAYLVPHGSDIYPLNTFAHHMLSNYAYINNIDLEQLPHLMIDDCSCNCGN